MQFSPAQLLNRTTHSYCWDVLIILLGQALRMGVSEASKGVEDKPLWCLSGISAIKFPRYCEKPLCFIFLTPFRICGRKVASSTFFGEIRIVSQYFLKENLSVATALFQAIESYRFLCREGGKSRGKQHDDLGLGGLYGEEIFATFERKKKESKLSVLETLWSSACRVKWMENIHGNNFKKALKQLK